MRATITDTMMAIATVMADRSEDPFTKVGAVATTSDNRIIATSYNGLLPGYKFIPKWSRDERLPFVVHAEQNLCSLIKRNEATIVYTTLCPCPSCLLLLAVHGIKKVVYLDDYPRYDTTIKSVAEYYNLELQKYGKAENQS
jgi:dCMP deaminase